MSLASFSVTPRFGIAVLLSTAGGFLSQVIMSDQKQNHTSETNPQDRGATVYRIVQVGDENKSLCFSFREVRPLGLRLL